MAYEYIVNGKRVSLPVNHDIIAVRFREPSDTVGRRAVIDPKPEVGTFDERFEVPNERLTIIRVAPSAQPGPARVAAASSALNADPEVERVVPVFDLGTKQVVAPDRIIVGFKPETAEKADEIISDNGGTVLNAEGDEYVVQIPPAADPFDVIAELMKRAEVDYAEPDFVTIGRHEALRDTDGGAGGDDNNDDEEPVVSDHDESEDDPAGAAGPADAGGDTLLGSQYAVRITQAVGAWQLVTGSRNIKIAILDEGVDVGHLDLRDAIVAGFDAVDDDENQRPNPWDAHGTACAGLAAATPNNNRGVRGLGGGCSLMAARIAFSPSKGKDWVVTNSDIVQAIDWAWRNGADILSNSWGGGAPSNAVSNAFERARTQGRGGRGCVIVVAAGNSSAGVDFPGTLANVLTVSASNEFDEPKTKTSADGETWWGSNFGAEVDVAAPGVHNFTTDITGADGYNVGGALDGDYYASFNGTSSSTPIVAGIAGLVLSANPSLREAQVRRLLKETADKVGSVVYTNGRNDRMGHGRVNALRAVRGALSLV
jgi:subtilisin family serine protease